MRVTITWSHWSPIDQDYPRLSSPAPQLTRTRANYQHATFMKYFWVLNEIFLARAAVGLCPQFCWSEYREIIFWSQLVNPLKHSSLHSAGVLSSPQHHADTNWPGSNSRLGSAVTPSFKSSGGWLVVTILMAHSVCRRHWGRYKSPLVLKSCSTPALGLLPTQYWISNTKSYIIYTSYKQYDILNNKYIAARRNLDVQMSDMPRPSPPVEKNVTTPEVAKNKSSVKGKPAKGDTKATKGKLKKTTLADLDASGIMDWQVRLLTWFTQKYTV